MCELHSIGNSSLQVARELRGGGTSEKGIGQKGAKDSRKLKTSARGEITVIEHDSDCVESLQRDSLYSLRGRTETIKNHFELMFLRSTPKPCENLSRCCCGSRDFWESRAAAYPRSANT